MSLVMDIADAVAAQLNAAEAGTFSQEFTAIRKTIPAYEPVELEELKVTVVPKSLEITPATRAGSQYDIAVDIGIQKKLASPDSVDAEAETLSDLVDEIAEHLRQQPLAAAPHANWVATANEPIYVPEHLAEKRIFTSVLTLTYRAMKA
jgi:hypothetical protein